MTIPSHWAVAWLVAASITALCTTLWDKNRARRREWRVPESTLWLISLLGGSVAMYATMQVIRHKTRHPSFMLGLPLLILAQAGVLYLLWRTGYLIFA